MHISRGKDANPQKSEDAIFTGEVQTHLHAGPEHSTSLRLNLVRFSPGGRTRWHYHPFDQALIITEGKGILATEETEHLVEPGDVILIPEGEKHWHGGTETTGMTHVAVNGTGENVVLEAVEQIRTRAD